MNLLTILTVLGVVGIVLYVINKLIPIDPRVKTIINWVVIIIVCLWLLKGLGVLAILSGIRI